MQPHELEILLQAYLDDRLTAGQWERLMLLLADEPDELVLQPLLRKHWESIPLGAPAVPVRHTRFFRRWGWAAAAAIILAVASIYLWRPAIPEPSQVAIAVAPGRNGAILTLADGSEIVLDSLSDGLVAQQYGGSPVLKNGQLSYTPDGSTTGKAAFNKIRTPKARQFHVMLPDGTQAWLNAASTIRYPVVFNGKERRVEIEGEVYFDVQQGDVPFVVDVRHETTIKVLGTSFNVNAYLNEKSIRTTLLNGSVRVGNITLKPGQQAVLTTGHMQVNPADTAKAIAWKNGVFSFEGGAKLEEVMRQLERWYDIEVVYEASIPDIEFMGEISRSASLDDVLVILRKTKVLFRLEKGRRLIVTQ